MFSALRYSRFWPRLARALVISGAAVLASCGGGGGGGGGITPTPSATMPASPTALAVAYGPKNFNFTWVASAEATSYKLFEDIDGQAGPQGFVQVGTTTAASVAFAPPGLLHTRLNAQYVVQACNSAGCSPNSSPVQVDVNKAIGYFKASNTEASNAIPGAGDWFGIAIALSDDGNTLAVGASQEDSNATGVNGDSSNNNALEAGAVYIFARAGGVWTQQAYVKASNTGTNDFFGSAVALSADGNTLSVGAPGEASAGAGIPLDDSAQDAGAVYVFSRTGAAWAQQAYIKASNVAAGNLFGTAIALSADGNALAAGASGEDASAGAAYVFVRANAAWTQQARVVASNPDAADQFGGSVALSGDGNTLGVGAAQEGSNATTVDGDGSNNLALNAGAVYIFARAGAAWPQQAYLKASNAGDDDFFGTSLAISGDGNTLAVGARGEASNATGIDGDEGNNTAGLSGAVYVFSRTGATWTKQAYIKASNAESGDRFGIAVALARDGNTLVVSATAEQGGALGLGGDQGSNLANLSGAGYVFKRGGAAWTQQAYVKASNTQALDFFGTGIALSGDGNTLAISTVNEDSNATGINGNQEDNSTLNAGAVYVY